MVQEVPGKVRGSHSCNYTSTEHRAQLIPESSRSPLKLLFFRQSLQHHEMEVQTQKDQSILKRKR
jgi:hypothetical protein